MQAICRKKSQQPCKRLICAQIFSLPCYCFATIVSGSEKTGDEFIEELMEGAKN